MRQQRWQGLLHIGCSDEVLWLTHGLLGSLASKIVNLGCVGHVRKLALASWRICRLSPACRKMHSVRLHLMLICLLLLLVVVVRLILVIEWSAKSVQAVLWCSLRLVIHLLMVLLHLLWGKIILIIKAFLSFWVWRHRRKTRHRLHKVWWRYRISHIALMTKFDASSYVLRAQSMLAEKKAWDFGFFWKLWLLYIVTLCWTLEIWFAKLRFFNIRLITVKVAMNIAGQLCSVLL